MYALKIFKHKLQNLSLNGAQRISLPYKQMTMKFQARLPTLQVPQMVDREIPRTNHFDLLPTSFCTIRLIVLKFIRHLVLAMYDKNH